jgi:hypothetical protein
VLFASLDYRDYLSQRGKYAPESIRKLGGRLMTPENFPDPSVFRPSDMLLMHTRTSFLSWLIMYFQSGVSAEHSIWSHVAMISYEGNIMDATVEGIIEHPFSDYFDGESYGIVLDTELSDEERAKGVAYGRSRLGTPYGWGTVFSIGLNILYGRDHSYHPKFSADVLIVLALLAIPGLRWKRWLRFTAFIALHYLAAVISNRSARERSRMLYERWLAETPR